MEAVSNGFCAEVSTEKFHLALLQNRQRYLRRPATRYLAHFRKDEGRHGFDLIEDVSDHKRGS
jgi:hypothetical protein